MKLLSLDGGGVFGIGQASILSRLTCPQKFGCVVGTSIGAVMAATVASCDTAKLKAAPDFFYTWAPQIFAGYWWRQYLPITPKYGDTALNKALQALFPGSFSDLRIPTFITTADLSGRKLKVYFSGNKDDGCMPLWEVLRMAVAAETYLSPLKGFSDGGIYANNPSMVVIAGAQSEFDIDTEDIELLSIGTGETLVNDPVGSTRGWTLLKWGLYLNGALLSGAANSMHAFFTAQQKLKRYVRIQFFREDGWAMDNAALVDVAKAKWAAEIQAAIPLVEAF